jgi:hypothetical protein
MNMHLKSICLLFLFFTLSVAVHSQTTVSEPNYDESKVPEYTLPDVLKLSNGRKAKRPEHWMQERRPEVMEIFETQVYGIAPPPPDDLEHAVISVDNNALEGKAVMKQVRILFTEDEKGPGMDLLVFLPKNCAEGGCPAFLGLNFYGNQSIHPDSDIKLPDSWLRNNEAYGITNHKATEASRGVRSHRWAVETIIDRGYALATVYYGDIDPDYDDGFENGVHGIFGKSTGEAGNGDDWGSIAAWAWGLSRVMDYFEEDGGIDEGRVMVMGHSRLGKTSLWAGAQDQRFAAVISNNSGCGGAALSRRQYGETVARINRVFPHWFCDNFNQYNGLENDLPVDQHMLIALIAPRPVYVASAEEDRWADPKGEYLSAFHAGKVYELFGEKNLPPKAMPDVGEPFKGIISYHIRPGKHDVTLYDWQQYLDFADRYVAD